MATRKVGRSWPTKLLRFVPSGGGRWPEPIKLPTSRAASRSKTRHLGWRLGITVLDRPFCRRSLSVSLGDPQHRRSRRHRREDKTLSSLGDVQLAAARALSPNPVRVCEVDAWSAGGQRIGSADSGSPPRPRAAPHPNRRTADLVPRLAEGQQVPRALDMARIDRA